MVWNRTLKILGLALLLVVLAGCIRRNHEPGILIIGFDIDDTVVFSYGVFQNLPAGKQHPIDFGWVNTHDRYYSVMIEPTVELVHFFRAHGHEVVFITAREADHGDSLAAFLTDRLGFEVTMNSNLFFAPKETIAGRRFTTKHRMMKALDLDLYYGDSDTDIIAALKAGVHPVRIVRHRQSVDQYAANFFGDTKKGDQEEAPFNARDLQVFVNAGVGLFGETIYPIHWSGPQGPELYQP